MEEKIVKAGIFWAVPDGTGSQHVAEFSKNFMVSEANGAGFINYPLSHFEAWDKVKGLGRDCYKYPRGRVIYDANRGRHLIYADECVGRGVIDEIVMLYGIEGYELRRDEHYVCASCARRKKRGGTLAYSVLRGQEKIGENLIEISYGDTKLLVELGRALEGDDGQFEREILGRQYAAVIISHSHEDHAGLIRYKQDCPIYLGHGAAKILQAMYDFHGEALGKNIKTYRNGRPFRVGGIKITPYLCDHSAYDSYMLLFEAGGRSVLYTGDFRFHGRKDSEKLLAALPEKVDVLIHEGTNLGKNVATMSEEELEQSAMEIMRATPAPVFVMQSGTNIDRLVSFYRAAKRSGRLFYMDNFTALMAAAAGGSIPRPDVFQDVVAFTPQGVEGRRKELFFQFDNRRSLTKIASGTKRFVMLVRPSMLGYVKRLFLEAKIKEATLIYSMWKGYKEGAVMARFLKELEGMGVTVVDLHTSGHASEEGIALLKERVKATQTVCVHTEK